MANPAIAVSKAGRDGRIVILDNQQFLSVSHHFVRSIASLADAVYGAPREVR